MATSYRLSVYAAAAAPSTIVTAHDLQVVALTAYSTLMPV